MLYYFHKKRTSQMSIRQSSKVNLEVKGTLAKLLATEDLIVEHKNVGTASFNVQTRVLTLPRWEKASGTVFDLLIAHEVGHAVFTPNEDWRLKCKAPQAFVNVAEDVRIENLMKAKFPGLPKTFFRGYHELHDKDFFELEGLDISELNIADRVNIHFKIGRFVSVTFTSAEKVAVDMCASARTFDEALAAAEALHALHEQAKQEQEEQQNKAEEPQDAPSNDSDPGNQGDTEGDEQDGDAEDDSEMQPQGDPTDEEGGEREERKETDTPRQGGGQRSSDLTDKVTTMENFSENVQELANQSSFNEPEYVTYPTINTEDYIADNSEIHQYIQTAWMKQKAWLRQDMGDRAEHFIDIAFGTHEEAFATFKREVQSEVNYMVQEFECKKSASAYARASTSKTGVLDCTKLHTYKYNEDLFKKVSTLPEGKNQGLVFVLDWSGSMCDILEGTMKQLLSLVMFCDKVNIPFDVYAFTNEWKERTYSDEKHDEAGIIYLGAEFSMMNILTSKVNRKELLRQMETMFVIASSYTNRSMDIVPRKVGLSGTPLNEAIIMLRNILPEFKERNNVEKAHVMVLTDGEAAQTRATREVESYDGKSRIVAGRLMYTSAYIRNRQTGTVRQVPHGLGSFTTVLLEDLRTQFPESTFTGFRILESRGGWFIRQATNYDEKLLTNWRKEKSIALTTFGYNKYYVVANSAIQQSSEFEVDDDASKAKIKSAFAKSLKGKKNNKKILGDFISLIA